MRIDHTNLGLPPRNLEHWFSPEKFSETIPKLVPTEIPIKNTEIPKLEWYKNDPGHLFWEKFPSMSLPNPNDINSPIDYDKLRENYMKVYDNMSGEEIQMMENTLHNLRYGADNMVDENLLPGNLLITIKFSTL